MSSRADFFHTALVGQPVPTYDFEVPQETASTCGQSERSLERYADDQIRGLIRQVFFPGWPRPARQVVFSSVGEGEVGEISMQIARTLAAQIPGSVCLAQGCGGYIQEDNQSGEGGPGPEKAREFRSLKDWARQLSSKLWSVPLSDLTGQDGNTGTADVLTAALRELRLEFDYTILEGPPAGISNEAALLGHLSDGIILILEAGVTRKLAAQRAKQMLHEANVRLLGTVLNGRRFPIPEGLYKQL